MKSPICFDTLRSFAYVNGALIEGAPRGIVIDFPGLGFRDMIGRDPAAAVFFAERRLLYMMPYVNPWMWMNDDAAALTDELIAVLTGRYGDLPVVSTGGSMGGQAALTYMARAAKTPVACAANCPVCDLLYHYTERPDLPRTLYSAYRNVPGTREEALATGSPIHLAVAGRMPAAYYAIFHCGADTAVRKEAHSDRFVPALRRMLPGCRIDYVEIPGRGHCDLGEDMVRRYWQTAADAVPS